MSNDWLPTPSHNGGSDSDIQNISLGATTPKRFLKSPLVVFLVQGV